jgi:hypothetical protein
MRAAQAVREAAAVYSIFQECLLWVRKETEKGVGVAGRSGQSNAVPEP